MTQSLSLLYVHLVFHIGSKKVCLRPDRTPKLYKYIGGILRGKECFPVCIGGMPDPIHILFVLSKNITPADLVRDVKRSSTNYLKTVDSYYKNFNWQSGYGAFEVSASAHQRVVRSINNQGIHHQKKSFKEEYLYMLNESGIAYSEEFLWNK